MSQAADVLAWLDGRTPAPPPALREHMDEGLLSLRGATDTPAVAASTEEEAGVEADALAVTERPDRRTDAEVATVLAEAALDRLRLALAAPEDRAIAHDLLAADALLTYACEAAAEAGPEALADLAHAYGLARLARLIGST